MSLKSLEKSGFVPEAPRLLSAPPGFLFGSPPHSQLHTSSFVIASKRRERSATERVTRTSCHLNDDKLAASLPPNQVQTCFQVCLGWGDGDEWLSGGTQRTPSQRVTVAAGNDPNDVQPWNRPNLALVQFEGRTASEGRHGFLLGGFVWTSV